MLLNEIQAGRLEFIFLPTTETGDFDATPGTKAAYCAMQQGKFWPMYDLLYDGQSRYGASAAQLSHIEAFASQSGLDTGQFDTCYYGSDAAQYVNTANSFANQRGLLGTPTIFIFVNGQQVMPSQNSPSETPGSMAGLSLPDLRQLIESAKPA
jgi:protein-disulfide isomerase